MTTAFSWQNSIIFPCFIPYFKAKFACYSRYFLTSYFCIPVPYNEKDILFNIYTEYIMRNAGLEEAQAGINIAGRNINHLRYADDTTLMAESEEELNKPLYEGERGE